MSLKTNIHPDNFSTFFKKNSTTVVFTVRKVVFGKKYPKIKYPTSKLLT